MDKNMKVELQVKVTVNLASVIVALTMLLSLLARIMGYL